MLGIVQNHVRDQTETMIIPHYTEGFVEVFENSNYVFVNIITR
jgi:hypothetical protein